MKRFEYRVVVHLLEMEQTDYYEPPEFPVELLNKEGAHGWELCSVETAWSSEGLGRKRRFWFTMVFKREFPDGA